MPSNIKSVVFRDEAAPIITHDELIAVDNMLLKHVEALRTLGAEDLATSRLNLRDRLLKILDGALQVR